MDSIDITVSPEDIAHGKRSSPEYCPIAQAIMKAIPSLWKVRVTRKTASLIGPSRKQLYDLPQEAKDFIDSFDQGTPVEELQKLDETDRTFRIVNLVNFKLPRNKE